MGIPEILFIIVMMFALLIHGWGGFQTGGNRVYIGGGFLLWLALGILGYAFFTATHAHGHG